MLVFLCVVVWSLYLCWISRMWTRAQTYQWFYDINMRETCWHVMNGAGGGVCWQWPNGRGGQTSIFLWLYIFACCNVGGEQHRYSAQPGIIIIGWLPEATNPIQWVLCLSKDCKLRTQDAVRGIANAHILIRYFSIIQWISELVSKYYWKINCGMLLLLMLCLHMNWVWVAVRCVSSISQASSLSTELRDIANQYLRFWGTGKCSHIRFEFIVTHFAGMCKIGKLVVILIIGSMRFDFRYFIQINNLLCTCYALLIIYIMYIDLDSRARVSTNMLHTK